MSNHKKGCQRDRDILALVESYGALNTDQIKLLLFPNVSERVCRRRLKALYDKKFIRRERFSISEPFYYYLGKRPGQIDHLLAVNWAYTWFRLRLADWEKIHSFEREIDYKILRTDGLVAIWNTVQKTFGFWFIELDRAESGNRFDKVSKYTSYYLSEAYLGTWWAKLAQRFPGILVVTTGSKQRIEDKITQENTSNLRFKVFTLEEIKEACLNG